MIYHILLALSAALMTLGLTKWYIDWAQANDRLDIPKERSSHAHPVAVSGGVVVILLAASLWTFMVWPPSSIQIAILLGAITLTLMGWIDDRHPIHWLMRLSVQVASIGLVLALIPLDQKILPMELPIFLDRFAVGLAWLWFVNLFNFMDGIDGLAAAEAIVIAIGLLLVHYWFSFDDTDTVILALLLLGTLSGFLRWNWHKAKVFLGDAGSIPLGFLVGWLLVELSSNGHWVAATILPLYFLADATITLLARLYFRMPLTTPHKMHFYQRAHQGGFSHDSVVTRITTANVVLIALALLSLNWPYLSLVMSILIVVALLCLLQQMADNK